MHTINTLINDVAKFLTNYDHIQEFLTHPNIGHMSINEISQELVYDNVCLLDLDEFNKNYDRILKDIINVIEDYVNRH